MFGAPYLWSNLHACNDKGIADGAAYVWSTISFGAIFTHAMTRVLLMEQHMFGAPYLWSNLHACNDKGIADGAAYVWSTISLEQSSRMQ